MDTTVETKINKAADLINAGYTMPHELAAGFTIITHAMRHDFPDLFLALGIGGSITNGGLVIRNQVFDKPISQSYSDVDFNFFTIGQPSNDDINAMRFALKMHFGNHFGKLSDGFPSIPADSVESIRTYINKQIINGELPENVVLRFAQLWQHAVFPISDKKPILLRITEAFEVLPQGAQLLEQTINA